MGIIIRLRQPGDDARIVELRNLAESDRPAGTVEKYRTQLATAPTDLVAERWVAVSEGMVVGSSGLFEMRLTEPGGFFVYIRVDPQRRRQGVGGAMYEHLIERATRARATRLYDYVYENQSVTLGFLQRRGVRRSGKTSGQLRLDVRTARLDGLAGVEKRLRTEGIRIETLAALGEDDEYLLRQLYELDRSTYADIPASESAEIDPFDVWLRHTLRVSGHSADICWLAMDADRVVGEARLTLHADGSAHNGYTGVHRSYRGRGIARALKLRTVEWCRQHHVDHIYTGTAIENVRMLAINRRLGYEELPLSLEMIGYLEPTGPIAQPPTS